MAGGFNVRTPYTLRLPSLCPPSSLPLTKLARAWLAEDVDENLDAVLDAILRAASRRTKIDSPGPPR